MQSAAEPVCAPASPSRHLRRGFSLVELLVVCAVIAILIALLLAAVTRARASSGQVNCLSNLRQIRMGFQFYAQSNADRFPNPLSTDRSWESLLGPYLAAKAVFTCPADEEIAPAIGASYDWRDTGEPRTTLAGRWMTETRGDAVLAFDALPGWHSRRMMNAVRIDGSAQVMNAQECLNDLQQSPLRSGR